jgi:hypothetical protein
VSQIKVILIAMKYIGILPITIPKSGKWYCSAYSCKFITVSQQLQFNI